MEHNPHPTKQRRYLPVIPSVEEQRSSPSYYGDCIFLLSPPPVSMPWGLGPHRGKALKIKEAWVLDAEDGQPVNLSAAGTPIRKNDRYMEYPFESDAFLPMSLFYLYILSLSLFLFYIINAPVWSYFGFLIVIPLFFFVSLSSYFSNYPNIIFDRVRGEIYIYSQEDKCLLIKKFVDTTFLFSISSSWASLCIVCERDHEITDEENYYGVDGARGIILLISTWENIRRYMEPGDGYKEVPLNIDRKMYLPFMGLVSCLGEKYFSPPHRWPPEIEMLLWPENKDAPLPHGWQYDTWIRYPIPRGGFDNTNLLQEREERLLRGETAPIPFPDAPKRMSEEKKCRKKKRT